MRIRGVLEGVIPVGLGFRIGAQGFWGLEFRVFRGLGLLGV